MNTIPIHFNDEPRCVPEGSNLQQALALLAPNPGDAPPTSIATALNGRHIARAQRESTPLSAGDHITTFAPIVGG